jgi:hypothetical protein
MSLRAAPCLALAIAGLALGCRDEGTLQGAPIASPLPMAAPSIDVPRPASGAATLTASPSVQLIAPGGTARLTSEFQARWSIQESGGGSIDVSGVYTAPGAPGTYHAVATSVLDATRSARSTLVVGLVDASRVTAWQPGVPGGIPIRTSICATVHASDFGDGTRDSTQAVQKAIDGCPSGEVVALSPGAFLWASTVRLNKGITLRGAGDGKTVVNGNNTRYVLVGPSGPPSNAVYATMAAHTRLTADARKGTSTIQVTDGSAYREGDLALISMKDDATILPPPGVGGDYLLWIDPDGSRHSNGQMVTIASAVGNTLTIQGVLHSDYTVANAGVLGRAPAVVKNAGVEGIRFVRPELAIVVTFCDECWVAGSETEGSGGDTAVWLSRRVEIRDNYIHDSRTLSPGGAGYGLTLVAYTSDSLVENNMIYFFNKPFLFRASGGGNVVAYNYIDGAQDGAAPWWMEPDIDSHTVYSHMELVEGNLCGAIGLVNTWGGAGAFTFFRNRVLGQHQDPRLIHMQWGNQAAITMNAGMGAYSNSLGNVLGLPGLVATAGPSKDKAAIYENISERDVANPPRTAQGYAATQVIAMYRLGNGSEPGAYASFDVDETPYPMVPKVAPTVIRHGDFDFVTSSVIRAPGISLAELPASLYRSDRPAFFGDLRWPWVEAGAATKVWKLPAKERFDAIKRRSLR